jgi:hypothetical protein
MKEAGFSETQATQPIATYGKAEKHYQLYITTSYTFKNYIQLPILDDIKKKSFYMTYKVISYHIILMIRYEITMISAYYSQ